jgi:hypothetical protein
MKKTIKISVKLLNNYVMTKLNGVLYTADSEQNLIDDLKKEFDCNVTIAEILQD